MNERDIQRQLMAVRYRRSFVLPNYTPLNWFECDVFELTEAGYFREYEIKLTLSDFKADQNKWLKTYDRIRRIEITHAKHEMLKHGDRRGPCQFWYVAPVGLLSPEIVPQWCGLIEIETSANRRLWETKELKPAPKLHKQKAIKEIGEHAESVCYWRMHGLLRRKL